jgi:hypothetical protein
VSVVIDLAAVRGARQRRPRRLTLEQRQARRARRLWCALLRWLQRDRDFLSASECAWLDQSIACGFNFADIPRLRRLNRLAFRRGGHVTLNPWGLRPTDALEDHARDFAAILLSRRGVAP